MGLISTRPVPFRTGHDGGGARDVLLEKSRKLQLEGEKEGAETLPFARAFSIPVDAAGKLLNRQANVRHQKLCIRANSF
jgi:hypothetical protein